MSQPFSVILTGDSALDRVQANIASAFNSLSSVNQVTKVNKIKYAIQTMDTIIIYDCTQIAGSGDGPITLVLPEPGENNGFSFYFKRLDSTTSPVQYVATGKNQQGNTPQINGANSPYQDVTPLFGGIMFCDGSNWWILNAS